MLAYLISSVTRRRLLRALWGEGQRGSISTLARLAGVSFAAAHRELCAMERAGLARAHRTGNRVLYEANTGAPGGSVVKALLKSEHLRVANYGVEPTAEAIPDLTPLLATEIATAEIPLEETLVRALLSARRHPAVARLLPVVLAKHQARIDFSRLQENARQLGVQHAMGFFIDLAGTMAENPRLRNMARRFFDKRIKHPHDFFLVPQGKYERRLTDINTPPLAKRWHFRMNIGLDSFLSLYHKFMGGP
ncbi:MAG: winged helix-turn-helix transcriptional regulator [Deltaproteobacteria bacterium]|nr:winged helix-turn-helix transcriptional regulator [Deltaproteobacteria bacterium]